MRGQQQAQALGGRRLRPVRVLGRDRSGSRPVRQEGEGPHSRWRASHPKHQEGGGRLLRQLLRNQLLQRELWSRCEEPARCRSQGGRCPRTGCCCVRSLCSCPRPGHPPGRSGPDDGWAAEIGSGAGRSR